MVYPLRREGILTEYNHVSQHQALLKFIQTLPNGQKDYDSAIRSFALQLYSLHAPNSSGFFLDKTPRYHNIIPELARIFPEAKFLLLSRNPLAVTASILRTWSKDRFHRLYQFTGDIENGSSNLTRAIDLLGERCLVLNYENFTEKPEQELQRICRFLNIPLNPGMNKPAPPLSKGSMGDETGARKYRDISTQSNKDWADFYHSRFRKRWAHDLLDKIGYEVVKGLGYNPEQLLKQIRETSNSKSLGIRDRIDLCGSSIVYKTMIRAQWGKSTGYWCRKRFLS